MPVAPGVQELLTGGTYLARSGTKSKRGRSGATFLKAASDVILRHSPPGAGCAKAEHSQPGDERHIRRAGDGAAREFHMTIRKLDKKEWAAYFNRVSKELEDAEAEIEVMSLALGDQIEAEWLPLFGIIYDPKDDLVEVAVENIDHMINKPREINVDEQGGMLVNVEIIDADGVRQIVKLREKLLLPAK
jgi:hypothetical protein